MNTETQNSNTILCPNINQCDIIISTPVARYGMKVGEVFADMISLNVPGIPFCNENNEICGRISLKHVLSSGCLPDDILKNAYLLGDSLTHLGTPVDKLTQLMQKSVDSFVIATLPTISSTSPLLKALALIRHYQSNYIFVVDEGKYLGVVTMLGLAKKILKQVKDNE
ncbi:CBS domain-containing protein [Candidatus Marithrix sp. Canyon 246]|uniref:CBS domain-containing protein n=1 Tax=Candidatus Marithrix sp. Canyon 246 TaxID=1827136 RepID=UPI00084A1957|nr:CBS domain-containing protein [Candidatus Marithrix sp. Canyon 246]